jgi:hypothetical protein
MIVLVNHLLVIKELLLNHQTNSKALIRVEKMIIIIMTMVKFKIKNRMIHKVT